LELTDAERAGVDLDEIALGDLSDVRDHLALPESGSVYGGEIAWSAEPAGVISTERSGEKAPGFVTRPEHGDGDVDVTLTAEIGGTERVFEATVRELPKRDDPSAYLFAH